MKDLGWRSFQILVGTIYVLCTCKVPLLADPYTTSIVHIVLNCGETVPKTVWVIPDDDDDLPIFEAERIPKSNIWSAKLGVPFNADGHVVSVRFDEGRTGCARSVRAAAHVGDDYAWLAQFQVKCDTTELWHSLSIESTAAVPFTTVRQMRGDVPCKRTLFQRKIPGELPAVAPEHEDIYIHFGNARPEAFQFFDMKISNGEFGGTPIDDELPVDRTLVVHELKMRGGRGGGNDVTIQNEFNLDKSVKTVTLKRVE